MTSGGCYTITNRSRARHSALLVCETGASPSRPVDRLVVRGLVVQGLVERTADPDDRRYVMLTLIEEGRRLEREIRAVENRLHDAIDKLTAGQRADYHDLALDRLGLTPAAVNRSGTHGATRREGRHDARQELKRRKRPLREENAQLKPMITNAP